LIEIKTRTKLSSFAISLQTGSNS